MSGSQYSVTLMNEWKGGGGNMPVYMVIALDSILVLDALTHCIAL